ncbi:hypothetical protein BDZ91DRAFT_717783 [Kalaharituber pfeilii]|nr:hypothetical protein BDZ91DRAFT_717783 [Kalaharituber pfeilii]
MSSKASGVALDDDVIEITEWMGKRKQHRDEEEPQLAMPVRISRSRPSCGTCAGFIKATRVKRKDYRAHSCRKREVTAITNELDILPVLQSLHSIAVITAVHILKGPNRIYKRYDETIVEITCEYQSDADVWRISADGFLPKSIGRKIEFRESEESIQGRQRKYELAILTPSTHKRATNQAIKTMEIGSTRGTGTVTEPTCTLRIITRKDKFETIRYEVTDLYRKYCIESLAQSKADYADGFVPIETPLIWLIYPYEETGKAASHEHLKALVRFGTVEPALVVGHMMAEKYMRKTGLRGAKVDFERDESVVEGLRRINAMRQFEASLGNSLCSSCFNRRAISSDQTITSETGYQQAMVQESSVTSANDQLPMEDFDRTENRLSIHKPTVITQYGPQTITDELQASITLPFQPSPLEFHNEGHSDWQHLLPSQNIAHGQFVPHANRTVGELSFEHDIFTSWNHRPYADFQVGFGPFEGSETFSPVENLSPPNITDYHMGFSEEHMLAGARESESDASEQATCLLAYQNFPGRADVSQLGLQMNPWMLMDDSTLATSMQLHEEQEGRMPQQYLHQA